jgi:ELWxxDGT repeat protein
MSTSPARAETFTQATALAASAHPHLLGTVGDQLVYGVQRPSALAEVHATDGKTDALLTSVGIVDGSLYENDALGVVGGKLIFRDEWKDELYATEGTAATTMRLAYDAPFSSSDGFYMTGATSAWFTRESGTSRKVWVTDGTVPGTKSIGQLAGTSNPPPSFAKTGNVTVFTHDFGADAGVWTSDGQTMTRIKTGYYFRDATACGAYVYFRQAPSGGVTTYEPGWLRTDGTANGITFVGAGKYSYGEHACLKGTFVFAELSKPLRASTGGAATDIGPPDTKVIYSHFAVAGDRAFFVASPPSATMPKNILYSTDGTAAGTIALLESTDAILMLTASSTGHLVAGTNGKIVLSDGTKAGTVVTSIAATLRPVSAVKTWPGARMFFWADDGAHGAEPWVSDGTPAGTRMLADVRTGAMGSLIDNDLSHDGLFVAGDTVFILADDGVKGLQIMSTAIATKSGGATTTDAGASPDAGGLPPDESPPDNGAATSEGEEPTTTASAGESGCHSASSRPHSNVFVLAIAVAFASAIARRRKML